MALNYDNITATTLARYRPQLADNVFTASALLQLMRMNGQVRLDGGEKLVEPLIYAEGANVGSFSGLDSFTANYESILSAAEYNWKYYYYAIVRRWTDSIRNSGSKERVIRLVSAQLQVAEKSLSNALNEDMWLDGTGNSGKDVLGLNAIAAIVKGHPGLLVGNIVGADILNILFVIGASAVAAPLRVPELFFYLHLPVMMLALLLLRTYIVISRDRFSRWQGVPLLVVYVGYIIVLATVARGAVG